MFNYVYVLQNKEKEFYVGCAENINVRLKKHNNGSVPSTRNGRPWALIFFEGYRNKNDAFRREKYLKTSQGARLLKRMLKEFLYAQKTS